ncbi:hypothetical protein CEXT_708201 [Caerostris extrusa]|uniref:Uncharacterized protein n=1 Tax=Caerostris extrusa TaxID=172846 RepID=A0AAV4Q6C5_CAEEX|nr:hypothetical protein CEXT_708201 [Caerostris extrusa]
MESDNIIQDGEADVFLLVQFKFALLTSKPSGGQFSNHKNSTAVPVRFENGNSMTKGEGKKMPEGHRIMIANTLVNIYERLNLIP